MAKYSFDDYAPMRLSLEDDLIDDNYKSYHFDEEKPLLASRRGYNDSSKWEPLIPRRIKKPKNSTITNEKSYPAYKPTTENKSRFREQIKCSLTNRYTDITLRHTKGHPEYRLWRHFVMSRQTGLFGALIIFNKICIYEFDFCQQLGQDTENVMRYNGDDLAMLGGEKCRIHGNYKCFCVRFRWGFTKQIFDFVEFARMEGIELKEREENIAKVLAENEAKRLTCREWQNLESARLKSQVKCTVPGVHYSRSEQGACWKFSEGRCAEN